jgi:hypothetical protein
MLFLIFVNVAIVVVGGK